MKISQPREESEKNLTSMFPIVKEADTQLQGIEIIQKHCCYFVIFPVSAAE